MRQRDSLLAVIVVLMLCVAAWAETQPAQDGEFNGLNTNLGNLSRLSKAQSRSISPENFTGEKGRGGMATEGTGKKAARELGQGWKVSPSIIIPAKSTFTLAEIDGSGAIQQIWMTLPLADARQFILRIYWDGEKEPSVEVPLGDFFACGWGKYAPVNSLPVCVNPGSAFNCYWNMPFRKKAKITVENLRGRYMRVYYQINYTLTDVPDDAAYFHAQFRRVKKLPYKTDYTILDGVTGRGQYVGTYMTWEARSPKWWGEGEIKFFLDGDREFPTICGTGTEDYFCGSYGFLNPKTRLYETFSTPFAGMPQVLPPDKVDIAGQRFGLYRWHIVDPVRFEKNLKVTMQALGWKTEGRYLPLQDDIASVAYWYQTEPHAKFPPLPSREDLIIQPISLEDPDAEAEAFKALQSKQFEGRSAYLVIYEPILDSDGKKVAEKKVTSVNLLGHPAEEEAFKLIADLYRIRTLNADKCDFDEKHLKHISGLRQLNNLILSDTAVTDKGLSFIRPMESIESLYLYGTKITDAGLEHLAPLKNLKILNLSNTKISDSGLKKLLVLNDLSHILLMNTEITDAGLETLARHEGLRRVSLSGAKVTPQGVAKMQKVRPKLRINYKPGE